MLKWLTALLTIFVFLASCDEEVVVEACPLSYTIDSTASPALFGKWEFAGFLDTTTNSLDARLCGNVQSFIVFKDSVHTRDLTGAFAQPKVVRGISMINSFVTTYDIDTSNVGSITFATETVFSKVSGTDQVNEFEERFRSTLVSVTRYQHNFNELWLKPGTGSVIMLFVAE